MENKRELSEKELEQIVGGSGTGAGMARWAWKAYNEGWQYVWGGTTPGCVDASGLIVSYAGGSSSAEMMFASATVKGPISSLPNQPGLGLYTFGHVGVYVGNGMAISAENESTGVVAQPIAAGGWTQWFQIPGVSY